MTHQADRVLLTTIKSCLKTFGRNTDLDSYSNPSYVIRAGREVIEKNKNKRNLSQKESQALDLLKRRVPPKPRKKPQKKFT